MANPKSKIPIARPRSEDALLQKSKEERIVSISPRAKSGKDDRSVQTHENEAILAEKLKVASRTDSNRNKKGFSNNQGSAVKERFRSKSNAKKRRTAFVIRIDRVGDKDVVVTEEIGSGWTEPGNSPNKGFKETSAISRHPTEERASAVSLANGKDSQTDSKTGISEANQEIGLDIDSDIRSESAVSSAKERVLSKAESFTNFKNPGTPGWYSEPSERDIKSVSENTNTEKLVENIKRERSHDTVVVTNSLSQRFRDDKPNSFNSWSISPVSNQAKYLGSYKPENSSENITNDKRDVVEDSEPLIHSHIISEITFVKDDSLTRFERIKSSESVRNHYDKRTRDGTFRVSSSQKFKSRSARTSFEERKGRYEVVNLENVNTMNVGMLDLQISADDRKRFQSNITKLSRKRIPVRKKLPLTVDNASQMTNSSFNSKENEKTRVLQTLNNRSMLETDETQSRLVNAENRTHDLKLVKQKAKQNILNELVKIRGKKTMKKNLLTNLNKNRIERLKNPVNTMFEANQRRYGGDTTVSEKGTQISSKDNETVDTQFKSNNFKHKIAWTDKRPSKVKRHVGIKNAYTQTTWHVQPKIHRFRSKKQTDLKPLHHGRTNQKTYTSPSSHENVQSWLSNSWKSGHFPNSEILRENEVLNISQKENMMYKRRNKKRGSAQSTFSYDISQGEYLPLRRLPKLPNKRKGMTRKRLGKHKGYEVSTICFCFINMFCPYHCKPTEKITSVRAILS